MKIIKLKKYQSPHFNKIIKKRIVETHGWFVQTEERKIVNMEVKGVEVGVGGGWGVSRMLFWRVCVDAVFLF